MKLTHLDKKGRAKMVDVSEKPITHRRATATGTIFLLLETLDAIAENALPKGDVFAAARIAGILAAKRCDELIPLCHGLPLDAVAIELMPQGNPARVDITASVTCQARTGAEMEALVAVSIVALTIYDMVKAVDREARISDIHLVEKSGGKSGHFVAGKKEECAEE